MSSLRLLTELQHYLCQLNATKNSAGLPQCFQPKSCKSWTGKKTLNPSLPLSSRKHKTYPSVNTGSRNASCKKKASLLRDGNVNNANSQKRTCYIPDIKHWGWGFNKGTSQSCSLEVFPSPDSRGCNRTSGSGPRQSLRTVLTHRAADADLSGRVHAEAEMCPNSKSSFPPCLSWNGCFLISPTCKNVRGQIPGCIQMGWKCEVDGCNFIFAIRLVNVFFLIVKMLIYLHVCLWPDCICLFSIHVSLLEKRSVSYWEYLLKLKQGH